MNNSGIPSKISGWIFLTAGLLLLLSGCYRFLVHHFDGHYLQSTPLTIGIIFSVLGMRRLRQWRSEKNHLPPNQQSL